MRLMESHAAWEQRSRALRLLAVPGRWHTPLEIGTRIFKDFIVGHLGGEVVRAPFDGMLRGVVRDGTEVPRA